MDLEKRTSLLLLGLEPPANREWSGEAPLSAGDDHFWPLRDESPASNVNEFRTVRVGRGARRHRHANAIHDLIAKQRRGSGQILCRHTAGSRRESRRGGGERD